MTFSRPALAALRGMLHRGYFPALITDDGQILLWEHVSWSEKFPGVLPDVIRALEADQYV